MEKLKFFACGPNKQENTENSYQEWILERSKKESFKIMQREVSVCSVSSGGHFVDLTIISIFYTE